MKTKILLIVILLIVTLTLSLYVSPNKHVSQNKKSELLLPIPETLTDEEEKFVIWFNDHYFDCESCMNRTVKKLNPPYCEEVVEYFNDWNNLQNPQTRRKPNEMERLTEKYKANYILERNLQTGETIGYARLHREGYVWKSTKTRETTRVSRRGTAEIISQIEHEVAAEMKLGILKIL